MRIARTWERGVLGLEDDEAGYHRSCWARMREAEAEREMFM